MIQSFSIFLFINIFLNYANYFIGFDEKLTSEEDEGIPATTPLSHSRVHTAQKHSKQRRHDKFIDFEQELYDEQDNSPVKNREQARDSLSSEEWKDKVEALPGKQSKFKKKKGFVSNISKKKIKEAKRIRKETTAHYDSQEDRYFGLNRQKTLGDSVLGNTMNQNRMTDLMQTSKFRMNMDRPQNI